MDNKDSEFLKRIQATFRIEAQEHLKSFSRGLTELEKTQTKESLAGIIETMFREVHSLKGAARSVGQKEIESVCQPLENLFAAMKKKEITLATATFDLFYKTVEFLSKLVSTGGIEQTQTARQNLRDMLQQLKQIVPETKTDEFREELTQQRIIIPVEPLPLVSSETEATPDFPKNDKQVLAEVVRIPISKLDPLLLQAEEFMQTKISFNQLTNELLEILDEVAVWKMESIKLRGHKSVPSAAKLNEWQEGNELHLSNLENHLATITRSMEKDRYSFEHLVDDHLDAMKQVLMLPVSFLVEIFPAMVRKISREQQKEIDIIITGSELEIDKRILEELKDPLIHLIRNSIDHGIGKPKDRLLQNKLSRGSITLSFAAKESGLVEITVSDDGKGIDKDQVLKAALKSGSLTGETAEKLNKEEILSLIYQSGVSTSSIITDLSGRGLGLSIVREKVEKLNGRLFMETAEDKGTTFRILLPMTLATFRGILIRLGEMMFILPMMNVERVMRMKSEDITTIKTHQTIRINEQILSLVNLAAVLGLPERRNELFRPQSNETESLDFIRIVILVSGENRIAFQVDEVLNEHQVLVKGLGKLLHRVKNISGATILGSGKIVPVLHIADLMKSAVRSAERIRETSGEHKAMLKSQRILIAEDSITSRTLLKNILETAGYHVTTAVDGADAYTRAKSEEFDLIVSDVDMPRMNGFELTAKIKSDHNLSEIPVVLVTSLESRDDRERGIEAGADAYIIKSSFDQGNLLEVIKKLI